MKHYSILKLGFVLFSFAVVAAAVGFLAVEINNRVLQTAAFYAVASLTLAAGVTVLCGIVLVIKSSLRNAKHQNDQVP